MIRVSCRNCTKLHSVLLASPVNNQGINCVLDKESFHFLPLHLLRRQGLLRIKREDNLIGIGDPDATVGGEVGGPVNVIANMTIIHQRIRLLTILYLGDIYFGIDERCKDGFGFPI